MPHNVFATPRPHGSPITSGGRNSGDRPPSLSARILFGFKSCFLIHLS